MPLKEAFKLALQSLWANKLRTILTLIGVVMGVAAVIMVITLVNGANRYVATKLSGYGADVFTVTRMASVIFSADDYFRYQKRKILRIEDYQAVRDHCPECSEVGALLAKSTNVVYNGHSSNNTEVRGYTWTMLSLNNIDIAIGRGFTPADEDHGTHDAIVGYDIVDDLLGPLDPIGKEIRHSLHHCGCGREAGQNTWPVAGQLGGRADQYVSADLRVQRLGGHLRACGGRRAGHGAGRGCSAGADAHPAPRCAGNARRF